MLFVGRVTTADVIDAGAVPRQRPDRARRVYLPPWARDPQRVLAMMAFSAAAQRLRLDRFDLQRFVDYEDEVIAESGIGG